MHIHKFERFWIQLAFVTIAFFIATVVYGFVGMNLKVIGANKKVDAQHLENTEFNHPGVKKSTSGVAKYDVYVKAMQFAYQPGSGTPITVPANTKITFHITSVDVIHGFEVVGTNLNTMVIPGEVSKFTTIFPEPKSYGVICNEYCGPAHHVMQGKINVIPKSEFDEKYLVK
ncbi:MAG TPA: cytochrome c oxidase subunit II [Balneolaceae bacterium]|nr:cytochrome c oxidase subunit II [Balneolaceae bacterium]